jgi:hypothetical protein
MASPQEVTDATRLLFFRRCARHATREGCEAEARRAPDGEGCVWLEDERARTVHRLRGRSGDGGGRCVNAGSRRYIGPRLRAVHAEVDAANAARGGPTHLEALEAVDVAALRLRGLRARPSEIRALTRRLRDARATDVPTVTEPATYPTTNLRPDEVPVYRMHSVPSWYEDAKDAPTVTEPATYPTTNLRPDEVPVRPGEVPVYRMQSVSSWYEDAGTPPYLHSPQSSWYDRDDRTSSAEGQQAHRVALPSKQSWWARWRST